MKKEIKDYLEQLETKFETNQNHYQAYKMIGSKILDLGVSSTQKGLNDLISESIDEMIKEDVINIIKVSYGVYIKKYMVGPLSITCSVVPLIKGKLSKKNIKTNTVFYTEDELESFKLRKGDYKLIFKGLMNESIEANPFKKYTRVDLENI